MRRKFRPMSEELKTARAGMACTIEELQMLEEAARIDGRHSIGEYMRAHIMPVTRQLVANYRFYEFSKQVTDPQFFAKQAMQAFSGEDKAGSAFSSALDAIGEELGKKLLGGMLGGKKPRA